MALDVESLFLEYGDKVYHYVVHRIGHASDAEDIVHEVFVKVIKAQSRYVEQNQAQAYVFRIAENCIIDYWRRRREHASMENIEPSEEASQVDAVEQAEMSHRLDKALMALPEKQRQVFMLRHQVGMTFKDIAAHLDEPINRILGRMHLAVKRIKSSPHIQEYP